METARQRYLDSKRRDLTRYAGMIGEEFSSKIDRLSQIIGTAHEPSVGAYKERLLRSCIENYLPKRYSVGTGFITFAGESPRSATEVKSIDILNLKKYTVSRQLDIIIFDDLDYAPIFRDDTFVVVRPEAVKAVIEVKGFLRRDDVVGTVDNYFHLGEQFLDYASYLGEGGLAAFPGLFLMAWDVYVGPKRAQRCDGRTLRKTIVNTYRDKLTLNQLDYPAPFPLLNSAYIYDDCMVALTSYIGNDQMRNGYTTTRGKFVRYDERSQPSLDRDCTISNLLAHIYVHLEVPFNPDFAYYDQSVTPAVLPHEFSGITDLVTGAEVPP